ncbi:hypothetical protein SLEP1_g27675 [Rubroshorea leprosula]|uniref:CCHC-type domain-containing protein n=1 Tax=Rubroshorea leprosula TaxID=152421 RepID=A0AAV5K0V6_9ROSI|nr:hypothetical protein SLEP1_g27675 [Rubroshorea leprosula]
MINIIQMLGQQRQPNFMEIMQTMAKTMAEQQELVKSLAEQQARVIAEQKEKVSTPQLIQKGGLAEFVKLAKPFHGDLKDPLKVENWIKEMEKTFRGQSVTEENKVPYAAYLLKEAFLMEYLPESDRHEMQQKFHTLVQGDKSVKEYEKEFNRLLKFAPLATQKDEESRRLKFLYGLNPHILSEVQKFEVCTYSTTVNKAKVIEQGQKVVMAVEESNVGTKKQKWMGALSGKDSTNHTNCIHARYPPNSCFKCGQQGHKAINCPQGRQNTQVTQRAPANQSVASERASTAGSSKGASVEKTCYTLC